MGKMILDDLRKRLERLDEYAVLMIDNNDRYQMEIVGGRAISSRRWKPTPSILSISIPSVFSRCPLVAQRCSSTHPVWKIW